MILSDRVRAGLRFQRDFIFADDMIHINRFTAKIQFRVGSKRAGFAGKPALLQVQSSAYGLQ